MVDVRSLLDQTIEEFPKLSERPKWGADIVDPKESESGVILLQ